MNILGISGGVKIGNQDAAAALLVDGRLVAAAEEERFTGIKFANGLLPRHAVRYCLQQAGLAIEDVEAIVFPGAKYVGFRELLSRYFKFHFGFSPPIELVDHHEAHAASTFYASGWPEALIVTADFSGDGHSTTIRRGRGTSLELLEEIDKPNSLGVFYSVITQYLGFQKDSDEYKVMGMAAYGQPRYDLSELLEITSNGYRLHDTYILGVTPGTLSPSKQEPLFERLPLALGPRVPGAPLSQAHYDLAASAQRQLELAMLRLVETYCRRTGLSRVCLAGGVALNCKMNQKVREHAAVGEIYVPPVCSDAGLALGAAYMKAIAAGDKPHPLAHAYWGPAFSADAIRKVLDRAALGYRQTDDPAGAALERLLAGKIVGWFQGRMEFGPRALGSRSILADPRIAAMKDEINHKVKFREEFRPVAPSVLDEHGSRYFADYCDSPYMTLTFSIQDQLRSQAPAIVHVDGTCRLQSVHARTNPLYHELISRFHRQTDVPMLINTSLNAYNDPMACEPHQALRTYFVTGLDCLVIGDFVLDKRTHDR
jgi:carbamoyltransferase